MDLDRYLERIGIPSRPAPEVEGLFELQRRHLLAVPFDALDCHLGNPVSVRPQDAYRKVVEQRRGGFCFELNGLFAELLAGLGFRVSLLAARPLRGEDWVAPPFAHLALLVELERRWLVDVGFGFPFAMEPLDVDEPAPQERAGRRYAIRERDGALLAEELEAPERRAYLFELEPHPREAFAACCDLLSTDPETSFVRVGPVLQQFEDGWVSVTSERVAGRRGGEALSRELADREEWRAALTEHFGLRVEGSEVRGVGAT